MATHTAEVRAPSHHRPGGGFRNPWPDAQPRGFADVLRWVIERRRKARSPKPDPLPFELARPAFASPRLVHTNPRAANDARLTVTWVGHSTMLLQLGAFNILTDPVWSERASPLRFAGPRRLMPPGVDFDALPPVDVVLLSHNHYDHLDAHTVRRLAARHPDAHWLAPLGLSRWLVRRGVRSVAELDWWQHSPVQAVGGTAIVTCAPAQHFSARGLGDRNDTLWCSWAVSAEGQSLYFGGDTGHHPDFGLIGERLGPFDVILLPIGAYEPRWFMRPVHMDPDEAVQAFLALRSRDRAGHHAVMVPLHWGTFELTDEPMDEPAAESSHRLERSWARRA